MKNDETKFLSANEKRLTEKVRELQRKVRVLEEKNKRLEKKYQVEKKLSEKWYKQLEAEVIRNAK